MSDEVKGLIFNKVQGSFVDGPGIRTTIFLKGCPLQCKWCCNPEGQSFQPELKVTYAKCNGCRNCLEKCPTGALSLKDSSLVIDRSLCNGCGDCTDSCYTGALEKFGEYYTVDEMFEFIRKDIKFYQSSGGGLTIGGGEATWHPEFVLALIEKCKQNGIHTAVDTCGYVTEPAGIRILQGVDLVLLDLKGMDPKKHVSNTGVCNDVILQNLRMLSDMRKPVIIRLPVIPGYTDSAEELRATAEFLAEMKSIERVDIMPVHHFGKVKYDQIGMEYELDGTEVISEEGKNELKQLFESYGLIAQIGG